MGRPKAKRADLDDDYESPKTGADVVPIKQFDKKDMQEKVKAFVDRIEEHNAKFENLRASKASLMKEATDGGLNKKILNKIVKLRSTPEKTIESEAELLQMYAEAVGLQLEFSF